MTTIAEHVLRLYQARKCWICGALGECFHREFEVEAAIIWAEFYRRMRHRKAIQKQFIQPIARMPLRLVQGASGGTA